jgi:hypothetical protein
MHRVVDASAVVVLSAEAEMSPALARLTTPRALALAPTAVGSCDQEDERVHVHVARAIFEEYGESRDLEGGPDQGQAPGAIAAGTTAVMAS